MSFDPFMLRHVDGFSVNNSMAHILYIAADAQESSFANLTLSIYKTPVGVPYCDLC